MKKFLTLVLALVFALALTVPAMAFTSDAASDDLVPELDIYLVEYEDDAFFGLVGNPPADRGYAKNEIVAAIVELTVPDDYDSDKKLDNDDYAKLVLSGDSVSLKVSENALTKGFAVSANAGSGFGTIVFDSKITLPITATGLDQDDTYRVLFFAKVTGDDASLTATLDSNNNDWDTTGTPASLEVGDYTVLDNGSNFVVMEDSDYLFKITVNSKNVTKDLYIYLDGDVDDEYLAVNPEAGIFYLDGARVTESSKIRDLQAVYEEEFVDEFGFDFSLVGGILKRGFFEDMNGTDDIEATVEIKPWTAYVTVPDNIVVDPPKTGDAASIMGFVMVALSGAGVVALRRRG